MKLKLLVTFISLSLAAPTYAQIFRLEITDYGAGAGIPAFEAFADAEVLKIQDDMNEGLPAAPPQRLMEGMADSSVFAGKGIGTDYASNMTVMLLGAGVGVGADLEKSETGSDGKKSISGAGVAPGAVIGFNLGFMDTKKILGLETEKLNLYFNFMNYSHNLVTNDKPEERTEVQMDSMAFGVHLRYDWVKSRGNKLLGWGGVKVNLGYEFNKTDLNLNIKLNKPVDPNTGTGGEVITGNVTGNPVADINVATHSIPLAITTDVQILYFLSLYTGVGVDFNWGQAKGKANLNADESTLNCTGGVCGGGTTVDVQASGNLDATGKVTPVTYRALAGVQFNLPFLRIFVQADKSLGNDVIGGTAGLRLVY